jgi:hypothetical protein
VRALTAVLAGAGLLGSTPAAAFELWGTGPLAGAGVQVTSDTRIRYYNTGLDDPGKMKKNQPFQLFPDMATHDYMEQVQRLNLQVTKDSLSIGLQFDEVALFSNRYVLDGTEYASWPLYDEGVLSPFDDAIFMVEKMSLRRAWDTWEFTVGDTYASFGRGMALNIVKNTDIDVDTSIRGARAKVRAGKTDLSFVTGLTNQQQVSLEYPNFAIGENTSHMVTGVRAEYFGAIGVGTHAVAYRFARALDEGHGSPLVRYSEDMDATVVGANLEVPSLFGMDIYLEGDVYDFRAKEMTGGKDSLLGYAGYASMAFYPGRAAVLLEAKKTRDTERLTTFTSSEGWEPANIPTLEYERVITEDSVAAVDSNDIQGARVRVDYSAIPGKLTPYLAVAYLQDEDTSGLHFNRSPETVVHPVAGVEWQSGHYGVQLNTGYRLDAREDTSLGQDTLSHIDGAVHFPLFGKESLEVDIDAKRFHWGENEVQQEDFTEMANALGWHHGEKWVFIFFQDWSDNPLIQSTGNLSSIDPDLYGAGEVQWKPSKSTTLKAFYGAYKAGIRCAGGQCRQLPGFNGAKLSVAGVF